MISVKGTGRFGSAYLLLLVAALSCAGCSAGRGKPLSQARLLAMEHNRRGVEAQARGERRRALAEFAEALRLQGSIDNGDGMVIALVNSARTQRLGGDLTSAGQSVERALALLPESPGLASELFYEKAKILLAAGELEGARQWAVKADVAEEGNARGRRRNLVATLLLRQGLTDQAREQSEQALRLNRSGGLLAEEANSLRLLGEIHLLQGRFEPAADSFQGALLLDKELGLSTKVGADLLGLGAVAAGKGETAAAIGWYRRALEVGISGADVGQAAAAMETLARLYRVQGDEGIAQQLEEQRRKLPAPPHSSGTP